MRPTSNAEAPNDDLLTTWKDVAAYLKCSVRKAQRLKNQNLPIRRIPGTRSVWASKSEIDRWLATKSETPGSSIQIRFPGQLWLLGILFVLTVQTSLSSSYGLTVVLFVLETALIAVSYTRLPDTWLTRSVVGLFVIGGVSYTAVATNLPALVGSVVNMTTLPPAFAYPFLAGLRFIPIPALIACFLVAAARGGNAGFLRRPYLRNVYLLTGTALLTATMALGFWGIHNVWQAGLPIRWTILAGECFVGGVNLTLFVFAYRFLDASHIAGYPRFLSWCALGCLLVAFSAAITNGHWTNVNRSHLDVRNPQPYRVQNSNVGDTLRSWLETHREESGADLLDLSADPEFLQALENEEFYKQDFDETVQMLNRAVIFGYKERARSRTQEPAFVLVRFPASLAAALQFVEAHAH